MGLGQVKMDLWVWYRIGGIYGSSTGLRWIYGSGTGLRWNYGSGTGSEGSMGLG